MKISHEVPFVYLEDSREFNDYEYALAHLLIESPYYMEFMKESVRRGRMVILDNSAYEIVNNPRLLKKYPDGVFDMDEYIQLLRELRPTYYMIPDSKLGSNPIEIAERWFEKISNISDLDGIKPIGVVHGRDIEEMKLVCTYFIEHHCGIAFSYEPWWYDYCKDNGLTDKLECVRLNILKRLNLVGANYVHILGCVTPGELNNIRQLKYINSIDTSYPIMRALESGTVDTHNDTKPKTTVDGVFFTCPYNTWTLELMKRNVKLVRDALRVNIYIFDFDDTLVTSDAHIEIKDKRDNLLASFKDSSYRDYPLRDGDYVDFSKMESLDVLNETAKTTELFEEAKRLSRNRQNIICILSSRADSSVIGQFCDAHGLSPDLVIAVNEYDHSDMSNAEKKREYIDRIYGWFSRTEMTLSRELDKLYYYDDELENLAIASELDYVIPIYIQQ